MENLSHVLPTMNAITPSALWPGKPLSFGCFWMHSLPAREDLSSILSVYIKILNTKTVTVHDYSACEWGWDSTRTTGLVRDSSEVQHPKCPVSQKVSFCLTAAGMYVCAVYMYVRANGHVGVRAGCQWSPSFISSLLPQDSGSHWTWSSLIALIWHHELYRASCLCLTTPTLQVRIATPAFLCRC